MEPKIEMSYKDIVKDEKSLIKYLEELVTREDLDINNKIFSACLAGRMFESERYFHENKEKIFETFMGSIDRLEDERANIKELGRGVKI